MSNAKTLFEACSDALAEIEKVGMREYFGLEQLPPNRIVDNSKCKCGGGCESVLECEFWYWVRKTPDIERNAQRQVSISRFRVDSLFECDGKKVVVELDGKRWHKDKRADWERDKKLIESVDAVIRIPYAAMHFYPHATFSVLASWYPRFKLRAICGSCFSAEELYSEIEKLDQYEPFLSRREWVETVEPDYEVWHAGEMFGFAGSVKAWIYRDHYKTDMIQRLLRPASREHSFDAFNQREFAP